MPTALTESRPLVLTEAMDTETGLFELQLITPGVGSCGAYPADVLESAVQSGVWAAGCHLYLDHPTVSEAAERPERSVRDLAGVLIENARWNGDAVVARARVYSAYRPLLAEAAQDIGMSIRAAGTAEVGEYNGQRMQVITSIDEVHSVDFVTRAGRGGAVLSVLESTRRALGEATANDLRDALGTAVSDAYRVMDMTWAYVRDFDPDASIVYFDLSGDDNGTFQQGYTVDSNGEATLTGDRTEVVARTTFVPVVPAGQSQPIESLGGTMPQIEEAEHRRLVEAAGRVQTLESERDAAVQRAEVAEARLATVDAQTTARPIVTTVVNESTTLPAPVAARVIESVVAAAPVNDAGQLDEAALRTAATEARTAAETEVAAIAESLGAGTVRGFGGGSTQAGLTESSLDQRSARVFGRQTVKGA